MCFFGDGDGDCENLDVIWLLWVAVLVSLVVDGKDVTSEHARPGRVGLDDFLYPLVC